MKFAIVATLFLVVRYLATRPAPSPQQTMGRATNMEILVDSVFGYGFSAEWRQENAKR